MRKLRIPLVTLLVLGAFWLYPYVTRPLWQRELEKSPTLILYSLEPHQELLPDSLQGKARYLKHAGSYILDTAIISSESDKKQMIQAVKSSLGSDGDESDCRMQARHAVGTPDGSTLVSICYECGIANIFCNKSISSDEEGNFVPALPAKKSLLDTLLKKYHLRMSHSDRLALNG